MTQPTLTPAEFAQKWRGVTTTEKVLKDVISGNLEFNGRIFECVDIPSSTAKEIEIIERIQQGLQRKRSAGRTG